MKTKLILFLILPFSFILSARAGSATWNLNPSSSDWNTAANWTPMTIPNRPADTATFQVSNNTAVSLSAMATVNRIIFGAGATAFTITANPGITLTISGAGIVNSSGVTQNFSTVSDQDANIGLFTFSGNATAGDGNVFTNHASEKVSFGGGGVLFTGEALAGTCLYLNLDDGAGPGASTAFVDSSSADHGMFINAPGSASGIFGGSTSFFDTATAGNGTFVMQGPSIGNFQAGRVSFASRSTAGSGTFICEGAAASFHLGGMLQFGDAATAGTATITANGGTVSGAFGSIVSFAGTATAAEAVITLGGGTVSGAGGATLTFGQSTDGDHPSAGNATLIANGGVSEATGGEISFSGGNGLLPDGGTARVELFGNGHLDNSQRLPGQALSVGSVEGEGIIFLGKVQLGVGTRNLDTLFSGLIQDGGAAGGTGGSLSKAGTGTLTLTGANTYTGGTTVTAGTLIVNNRTGSATGTGAVQVKGGTLGGSGTIAGAVTIATAGTAFLAPAFGTNKQVTLTLQSSLTLQVDATYTYTFKARSNQARTDLVVANGVTINGATLALQGKVQGTVRTGLVLTVLSNTSANPISGTFSNLAEGAIVKIGSNNFQASYHGGDGNDLTLTVVP